MYCPIRTLLSGEGGAARVPEAIAVVFVSAWMLPCGLKNCASQTEIEKKIQLFALKKAKKQFHYLVIDSRVSFHWLPEPLDQVHYSQTHLIQQC